MMKVKKILYNTCHGGFGFSEKLLQRFNITDGQWGKEGHKFCSDLKNRINPEVIKAVEELGLKESSGECSNLSIEEIDDGDVYRIDDFDGYEKLIFVCNINDSDIIF
jgi:hypothetical protein